MTELYGLIAAEIPDLESREETYRVNAMELDDELLEAFVEQLDIDAAGIESAVGGGNLVDTAAHAHSIKGMGGTMGKPELSVLGEELERAAKTGDAPRCRVLSGVTAEWLRLFKEQVA